MLHHSLHSSCRLCLVLGFVAFSIALIPPTDAQADPVPPADRVVEWDVDGLEELLPRHETQRERDFWKGREDEMPRRSTAADPPPTGPIRNCAEWEPVTGVLVRYPLGLPYALLRDIDDQVKLHVIVSSSQQTVAENNLSANGVDMDQVEFLIAPSNSIWTRDYGPWFVFDGAGDLTVVDHVYNRPFRPNDNLIPIAFANQQGIPVVGHDMWHTGGNYMTDGANISSSTALVYNEAAQENGMSESDVDQLMDDYYGITSYQVLDYIESGGIHHIDTWAKFLTEEDVLVKEVWTSHHTYDDLEQRSTLLASLPSSTGRNYRVHRVYCHNIGGNSPASYTNSLVVNDHIYVPLFGNATYDNDALAVYEAAAPGYEVSGYVYGGWLTDDALHCRTKGMMDAGMLRVAHIPVLEERSDPVEIEAFAEAHSGGTITTAELVYRRDGGSWTTTPLVAQGGGQFAATIPQPTAVTSTDYYVQFEDDTGRSEGMPRVAPNHWYTFQHAPDPASADVPSRNNEPSTFPNPFHTSTTFAFELAHADAVQLDVFDASGRQVRALFSGEGLAGRNEIRWDGRDDSQRMLPAGVYYFRLRAAGIQYSRPVQLTR